jgi:hypothetical protein
LARTQRNICIIGGLLLLVSGCISSRERGDALADTGKQYCQSIRALNIFPVYPLNADLQVGDVFLVDQPIENETKIWNEKGFLPLPALFDRLDISNDTWKKHYVPATFANIPSAIPGQTPAPGASFPEISIDLGRSGGIGAGMPIQGVAVSAQALGTDRVHLALKIGDAFNCGLPEARLMQLVHDWRERNVDRLRRLAPTPELDTDGANYHMHYRYLRVVSRVFYAKKITAGLTTERKAAGGFGVGNPPELKVPPATQPAEGLAINLHKPSTAPIGGAKTGLPLDVGATAQAELYRGTHVVINEEFETPRAVGLTAIDIPILYNGELGPRATPSVARIKQGGRMHSATAVYRWLQEDPYAVEMLDKWLQDPKTLTWLQVPQNFGGAWIPDDRLVAQRNQVLGQIRRDYWLNRLFLRTSLEKKIITELMDYPDHAQFIESASSSTPAATTERATASGGVTQ